MGTDLTSCARYAKKINMLDIGRIWAAALVALAAMVCPGCGGQLAKPGFASVAQVCPDGKMLVHYHDGKAQWKRLESDNLPKDVPEMADYLYQPARLVETAKGSTITFPDGKTFIYRDLPKP